jgi:hypothetical protein
MKVEICADSWPDYSVDMMRRSRRGQLEFWQFCASSMEDIAEETADAEEVVVRDYLSGRVICARGGTWSRGDS